VSRYRLSVICQSLGATALDDRRLSSCCGWQRRQHLGNQSLQIGEGVATRLQDDDRNIEGREVLLVLEFSIDGYKDVKPVGNCKPQQFAVALTGPARLGNGPSVVAYQVTFQPAWQTLIEENAHGRGALPWPARAQR
jgi:hypothetical protein